MLDKKFKVVSNFEPTGDQPQAIDKLAEGIDDGLAAQVLLGATGTGKTYTVAKVIGRDKFHVCGDVIESRLLATTGERFALNFSAMKSTA